MVKNALEGYRCYLTTDNNGGIDLWEDEEKRGQHFTAMVGKLVLHSKTTPRFVPRLHSAIELIK